LKATRQSSLTRPGWQASRFTGDWNREEAASVTQILSSSVEQRMLDGVQSVLRGQPIRLVIQSSGAISEPQQPAAATVTFADLKTLGKVALDPETGFCDGYVEGRIHVDGDLLAVFESALVSVKETWKPTWHSRALSLWLKWMQANTPRGSRRNIRQHYDLDVDFYRLWLDAQLLYTCAYFPEPSASLEAAQIAKMDYVCRKVQLQPGEKVVEAGCGWGALALHMARHYGVTVRAYNISHEQILFARARATQEGLEERVEFIEDDYRSIRGSFDAFLSVGMLEHVGPENYKEFGRMIHRTVGDTGRGLIHFIGRDRPLPLSPWVRKRIFPGGSVPTLRKAMEVFEDQNYSVLDVENLRWHYAKTLEHWLERFERSTDIVEKKFGAEFVRAWRVYLAGSLAAFHMGTLQLFQIVFCGRDCRKIPWTRAHLYEKQAGEEGDRRWIHAMS
jgi:cyclopropane-fatty-acyl-phospholipid synthase